ncbi:MAG: hypothetical protein K9G31_07645 [Crocinitomicaceae bacterium]|jgi:hypothetical protein|nr:hypothetical protein [Crocinitomicaceae bacterium]
MTIKTTFLLAVITIAIFGCTPQNPQPNPPANNGVVASWQATINGVSNSYSDTYTNGQPTNAQGNNEGKSDCFIGSISLVKGGPFTPGDDVSISFYNSEVFSVGTYNITSSGSIGMSTLVNYTEEGNTFYPNTNVTLNITEVASTIGGLIKGNFSGVIGTPQPVGGTIPVSGQFQAIRTY